MFGYININKQELSKEDLDTYTSYYCGLCRALGERFGKKGQLLLNYDCAFLIILLSGLYELDDEKARFICPLHPTKKHVFRMNEATHYAADMNVLLSYQNMMDNIRDSGSKQDSFKSRFLHRDYMRILNRYPRQGKAVENAVMSLWRAEKEGSENIDEVAGYTGQMLSEIFLWKEEGMWADDLKTFGFYLGKFIYLMDAYEDVEKDHKAQSYNALTSAWLKNEEDFDTFSRLLLTSMMSEAAKAFERMPVIQNASIIRNILYSGVWTRFQAVYAKRHRKDEKEEKKKEKSVAKEIKKAHKKTRIQRKKT